jgi:hypothetical protein
MRVERFSEQYRADVALLCKMFFDEAVFAVETGEFDDNVINASIDRCKDAAYILIVDNRCVGVLAGQIVLAGMTGSLLFQEVIWYVHPAHRKYSLTLYRVAVKGFQAAGVKDVIFAALHNPQSEMLHEVYGKMGFTKLETHYIKKLT